MALQFDPQFILGSSGNVLNNTVLNNYPTAPSSVTFNIDVSNSLGCYLQLWNIGGGSVTSATNGLFSQIFSTSDGVWYDTNAFYVPSVIPTVANSNQRQTYLLSTGKYQVQLVNTDPSYSINVMATSGNLV